MIVETKNLAHPAKSPLREQTVGSGVVAGLLSIAVRLGAEQDQLILASGIDATALADSDCRIPISRFIALLRAGQAQTGRADLALLYGEATDLSQISVLGLICRASETMLEAFEQMNRYGQLVVEAEHLQAGDRFQLVRRDGALWIVDNRRIPIELPELVELAFSQMACGTRPFGDTPFILEVLLAYPAPAYADQYDRIFRAPVRFSSGLNAMRIDETWLTHRIAAVPRYVFGILSSHADRMLERLKTDRSMRGQVEATLLPIIHTGSIAISNTAATLGLSTRTLSRRLTMEQTSFSQVLDDLRQSLTRAYLSQRQLSISEVAYLVGFSDVAAFSRACKRWTGMGPRALRHQIE